MPTELRNRLWSIIESVMNLDGGGEDWDGSRADARRRLYSPLWDRHFKRRMDQMPPWWSDLPNGLSEHLAQVVFTGQWMDIYDLMEFLHGLCVEVGMAPLDVEFNRVLEEEQAAWRFAGGVLQPVTSSDELEAINSALGSPLVEVREHIASALSQLGRRPEPDTRNAIKEAISAVEAAAKLLEGDRSATFASLVQKLEKAGAQPQFIQGWKNFYNYTSGSSGIRHALKEGEAAPSVDEAKLFVITSSAFVNYLVGVYAKDDTRP